MLCIIRPRLGPGSAPIERGACKDGEWSPLLPANRETGGRSNTLIVCTDVRCGGTEVSMYAPAHSSHTVHGGGLSEGARQSSEVHAVMKSILLGQNIPC